MSAPNPALELMISQLKKLGSSEFVAEVAKEAAPEVLKQVQKTASAGQTPTGQPWKPTKKGNPPLKNAASHITSSNSANVIGLTLTGPDVFHHKGLGGAPRRQVIPDSANVPRVIFEVVTQAAAKVFRRVTGK